MAPSLHFALLQVRALSSTANITCAKPMEPWNGEPIAGSLTFHHLMILVSAVCLGITIASCVFLSWKHLHRWTVPQEQRQILRIVNLPAAYAIFHFLALCFYQDFLFIQPISGIYEAWTVAALFLLFLEYVCPDGTDREKYFENIPPVKGRRGKVTPGLQWYYQTWSQCLQYPLTKFVIVVIEIITQYFGVYCENSFSPKYAHLWLTIADFMFIGGAFGAAITFVKTVKNDVGRTHRGKAKVYSFVGIIIFQILQGIVFGVLNGKLFSPSAKVTYDDINFGIPAALTCIESVIFSLIFLWAYSSGEYAEGRRTDRYGMGPLTRTRTFKAILDALNISDIIAGTFLAFQLLFTRVASRYGKGGQMPQNARKMDATGMEPLSDRSRMRGYSGASEFDAQDSPPLDSGYDDGMHVPPMPRAARDPSSGRQQTFRADDLRPQYGRAQFGGSEYAPLNAQRDPSPSGLPEQHPREMM